MKNLKDLKYVMDASVLVAVAANEPHLSQLPEMFLESIITSVNLAEALTVLVKKFNIAPEKIWDELSNFISHHYAVDDELTLEVVRMATWASKYGLSLGDRYCLALGKTLTLPVYTADKIWKSLESELDIKIHLIR